MKLWVVVEDYDNMAIDKCHYFYDDKIRGVYESYMSAVDNMENNLHEGCKLIESKENRKVYQFRNSFGDGDPIIVRRIVEVDTTITQDGIYNDKNETRYMFFTLRKFQ